VKEEVACQHVRSNYDNVMEAVFATAVLHNLFVHWNEPEPLMDVRMRYLMSSSTLTRDRFMWLMILTVLLLVLKEKLSGIGYWLMPPPTSDEN